MELQGWTLTWQRPGLWATPAKVSPLPSWMMVRDHFQNSTLHLDIINKVHTIWVKFILILNYLAGIDYLHPDLALNYVSFI